MTDTSPDTPATPDTSASGKKAAIPSSEAAVKQAVAKDMDIVKAVAKARDALKAEIHKIIVGQDDVIDLILIALFCRGHALLIGVPGLAKTLTVSTLAKVLRLTFTRIQFTPDLMPSDITGSELIEQDAGGKKSFVFQQGPIFANILLADEINRTPPKTQAALLEAMQERQVTVSGKRYPLDPPFFVLATQNPIEQEGTYPLPEAQLDRFMFTITVDYPSHDEEREILRTTTVDADVSLTPILDAKRITALQSLVRRIPVSDQVIDYALALTRCTRPKSKEAPDFVKQYISWGAGPRSGQALILAAKALAILDGRPTPGLKDVAAMTKPVLRHRIATNFNADAEGLDADHIIEKIVATVKPPKAK